MNLDASFSFSARDRLLLAAQFLEFAAAPSRLPLFMDDGRDDIRVGDYDHPVS